ncbi:ankyrin repeat-containing domain protein [Amanita rubescens]|nr:ankyrin repeat-containing domain protein [Amanita rubescens]
MKRTREYSSCKQAMAPGTSGSARTTFIYAHNVPDVQHKIPTARNAFTIRIRLCEASQGELRTAIALSGQSVDANYNQKAPVTNQILALASNQFSTKLELRQRSVIASEFQRTAFSQRFNILQVENFFVISMKFRFPGKKRNAIAVGPAVHEQRMLTFMDLPVEIHQCIVTEFIKDLRTTFDEIKALRLVCRRFDAIVKPRVYSSRIKPFGSRESWPNVRQLLTLLSSKPNEQLNVTTTLFIRSWFWLSNGGSVIVPFREVHFIDYIFLNAASLIYIYIVIPIMFPGALSRRALNEALCTFAKLRLYVPWPRKLKFNLPNLSCIVWNVDLNDPKWIISRTAKILRQLPRLSELFLGMDEALEEFNHLVKCFSKLHNLRKLGFRFRHDFPQPNWLYTPSDRNFGLPRINEVGKIIAENSNLTHLEVTHSQADLGKNIDLAQMLAYVPADYPLKLEHVCLSHSFRNLAALAPHIRSLTSIDLADPRVLNELLRQGVFPPTITLKEIDQHTIEYLDHHPEIISLTIFCPRHDPFGSTILRILSRHSKTLTHLGVSFHILCDQTENELAFLQCTNLKQLAIHQSECSSIVKQAAETLLSVIAQLPDSLTLVVDETWTQNTIQVTNVNKEELLEKFKKWLAVPDPSINHNIAREKHHKGTCQWLLDDKRYISWKEQSNSFMWINGISGCGKTLICSTIIEDIKDIVQDHPGTGLAYFYFDINDKMKQTSRSLLSSLILSLTVKSKNFLLLEKLYDKHEQPTKAELLCLLMNLLQLFQQAYIVIDALDECDDYYQLFVQVVKIIYEWRLPHFHLLVSSRREQHIITSMGECSPAEIFVKEDHRLKRWNDIVQQDIKNALISGANGMFHWVACQVEELKHCQSEIVLIQTLKSLPKDLETTYDQILQRIHKKAMSSAKVILLWLALGMRSFTQEQLAIVVTFDPSNGTFDSRLGLPSPDDVLQVCSSLIMKTSYNTVRLAHATVREYLINNPGKIGLSDLEAGHSSIAHFCLSYLLHSGWQTNKNEFLLLQYSAQLWPDHYKLSSKDETLQKTVIMFLQSGNDSFKKWVGIYQGAWEIIGSYSHISPLHYAALLGLGDIVGHLVKGNDFILTYGGIIQIAANHGYVDIIKMLLDKGANVNTQGEHFGNALQAAVCGGHLEVIKLLVNEGADVNAQVEKYGSALYQASLQGHAKIVMFLLEKAANVNAQGGEYGSALQAASHNGCTEIVMLLLDKGADVNAQNGRYGNALYTGSYGGHAEIVRLLLDKGADVNAQGGKYGNALQAASYRGRTEIVRLLLDKEVDVNVQGGFYGNSLQAASYRGHTEIVRFLLDKRADVNAQGGEYGNSLQSASYRGQTKIVRLLLDKGANVDAQGGKYGNALQAASSKGSGEIVRLLLNKGADVNASGGSYGNALQAASSVGHAEIVMHLLDKGADVNIQGGLYGDGLRAASLMGHAEIVRLLLDKGADVNSPGGFYDNALYTATYKGHAEIVMLLLDKGADVNAQGGVYGNALYTATYKGHAEIVMLLLDKGADVNAQGGVYGNGLQAASCEGHAEIVRLLLDKGADMNSPSGFYDNALYTATYMGHAEIVMLLLDKGADVNAQGGVYGNALQAASHDGCAEIAMLLLDKGANVNAKGGKYDNALQAASHNGHADIVRLLLDKGADVNAQGGEYYNALQAASSERHAEIVRLLLEKGADVNIHGGKYGNALQAASHNGHAEIAMLLLDRGANVNSKGRKSDNALQAASHNGHADIVRLLLDKGADVNAQGGEYGNALQAASSEGHAEIVRLLLDKGADMNAQGGEYGNALQAASSVGHAEIARLLLDKGADVNAHGGKYGNALQAASSKGYGEIVMLLLETGANVNAPGGFYNNALYTATCKGHAEIVMLLLDKGGDVNAQGGSYGNALQAASSEGHAEIVRLLLDKGADVNAHGGKYGHALQAASDNGHAEIAMLVLDKGANVNSKGGKYDNGLQAASHNGHADIVRLLLDQGADVNAQGGEYGNGLQAASCEGHAEIVRLLLDKGADVNAQGGEYGNGLQAASCEGHAEIVRLLLDKGADVNAQGGEYGNALQAASSEGHAEIVRLLLDKGADVNAQSGFYANALQAASSEGHTEIVRLLLDKGADANAQGGFYGNALQAASDNDHAEIAMLLLDKSANVNSHGGFYGNALQAASSKGYGEIVMLLLDKGADVDAQGGKYGNALQAASHNGDAELVRLLLDRGANVNAQGGTYGNALQAASHNGHAKIVRLLLDKGANDDLQGEF